MARTVTITCDSCGKVISGFSSSVTTVTFVFVGGGFSPIRRMLDDACETCASAMSDAAKDFISKFNMSKKMTERV